MILYANGDSNTYGDELVPDCYVARLPNTNQANGSVLVPHETPAEAAEIEAYRISHSWPALLGKQINADRVVNQAIRGGSNDRMFRTTLAWLDDHASQVQIEGALIILGVSGISRTEIYLEEPGDWAEIGPTFGPRKVHKAYYGHVHSHESDAIRLWQGMLAVQNTCKALRSKCLFFPAYPDHLLGTEFLNPRLGNLIDRARLIPENVWDYCSDTPMGPRMHYLAEGHAKWAELLHKYLPFS